METYIILALGFLVAIWIALIGLTREIRGLRENGVHTMLGMKISDEDMRKIVRMVLEEKRKVEIKHLVGNDDE